MKVVINLSEELSRILEERARRNHRSATGETMHIVELALSAPMSVQGRELAAALEAAQA